MSKVDALLSALQKVKARGTGRWIACCPAHNDRNPSMTIREMPDERILIHCFAGCGVNQILESIGVPIAELFPDRLPEDNYRPVRMPAAASDILACVATDSMFVYVCAVDLANGETLNDTDRKKLLDAASRLQDAASYGR